MTAVAQEPEDWCETDHYRRVPCCFNCSFVIHVDWLALSCGHPHRRQSEPHVDADMVCDQYQSEDHP